MILYRPTGMDELRLVYEMEMKGFPPRLPEQPIFYPVLNFDYAAQIARDWNTKSRSFAGYVTRFEVDEGYVARFDRQIVGGREHEELWVPAEELQEFNLNIIGRIEIVAAYFGSDFRGLVPEQGPLAGVEVATQPTALASMDLGEVVRKNHIAIFLNYPFWELGLFDGIDDSKRSRLLSDIREVWADTFPEICLPMTEHRRDV